ncbi:DUF6544 family protein [Amphibacillus sediminis]|uniref:DUF6544 family protein n=1 Tax=Amphibacillus sediminis TaxID=360185 RepID=UPI0008364809|nr:DUF6544 family protein [Amphibacillus sediminis]
MLRFILSVLLIGIVILIIIVYGARISFDRMVKKEITTLFSDMTSTGNQITEQDLKRLPNNVQSWLRYAGVVNSKNVTTVRLKQSAQMRLAEDKPWMEVEAEQYFTTQTPAFIWKANVKAAPLFNILARDKYIDGKGNMLIKPLALFTVADAKGKEIDQGTLVRYLAEIAWFPTAALSSYIVWEELNDQQAKATLTYQGIEASGIFTFNNDGEVIMFEADRYGEFDGEFRLERWLVHIENYQTFQDFKVPTKGQITWDLDSGEYNWFNFEIQAVEYDQPSAY